MQPSLRILRFIVKCNHKKTAGDMRQRISITVECDSGTLAVSRDAIRFGQCPARLEPSRLP